MSVKEEEVRLSRLSPKPTSKRFFEKENPRNDAGVSFVKPREIDKISVQFSGYFTLRKRRRREIAEAGIAAEIRMTSETERRNLPQEKLVLMAVRVHPFPSRTRKLSSLALTILGWKRPGKIGRRQHQKDHDGFHHGPFVYVVDNAVAGVV